VRLRISDRDADLSPTSPRVRKLLLPEPPVATFCSIVDHPQREVPSTIDTGEQQEYHRARDGMGCEGFLGNQSVRANDQFRTTERWDTHLRKPIMPMVQNHTEFIAA
jgi:hypothetical protein